MCDEHLDMDVDPGFFKDDEVLKDLENDPMFYEPVPGEEGQE